MRLEIRDWRLEFNQSPISNLLPSMTANIAVQNKFDHIAADYQQKYARPQTLMAAEKQRRLALLLANVQRLNPDSVLDVGCGAGNALGDLRQRLPHAQLSGIDISFGMLQQARSHEVPLSQSVVEKLPLAAQSFDLVYAMGVIDYLPEPAIFFEATSRILRPNGHLLFTYPNAQSLYRTSRDRVKRAVGYGRKRVSAQPLQSVTIDRWLAKHQLQLVERRFITYGNGVVFLPLATNFNRWMEGVFGRTPIGKLLGWSAFCIAQKTA